MWAGQTDLTAQLSDEILCHVFSYLTLKDKLQSEAVNIKFQRCIIEELRAKPLDLKIEAESSLNGFHMMPHQLLDALVTLAKKAKFSTIQVKNTRAGVNARQQWLDRILRRLISECECLTKLKTFTINSGCSQVILENFLEKCEKLSIVKFDFNARPIDTIPTTHFDNSFPVDFSRLFRNIALAELRVCPYEYDEKGLIQLFAEMKPNTLKIFDFELQYLPATTSMPQLIHAIASNAGSTLTDLNLQFTVPVLLDDCFHALSRLTVLRKCDILCCLHGGLGQQFVSAAIQLFKLLGHVDITVNFREMDNIQVPNPPACKVVSLIKQIQVEHAQLAVRYDWDGLRMVLSVGSARISKVCIEGVDVPRCQQVENCLHCKSFYPSVLAFVRDKAHYLSFHSGLEAQHFPEWRLDRCMVDQILENLVPLSRWNEPISANISEDQQMVTLRFRAKLLIPYFFTITLSCSPCMRNGCLACI